MYLRDYLSSDFPCSAGQAAYEETITTSMYVPELYTLLIRHSVVISSTTLDSEREFRHLCI